MSLVRTLAIRRLKKNNPHMDQKLTLQVVQTLQIIYQGVRGVPGTPVPGFLTVRSGTPNFTACNPHLF